MPAVRALLFDLGKVVVDVDFARVLAAWARASGLPPGPPPTGFPVDEAYCRHEIGAISSADYFAHLKQALALSCDDHLVRDGWNATFSGPITETVQMIEAVAPVVPCYALSNTNAAHLQEMQRIYPQVLALFRQVFASHEIACRKPDPAAYRYVLDAIAMAPADVLFFDDLEENVEAARACGLQAVQVRGPDDVRRALVQHRLLPR